MTEQRPTQPIDQSGASDKDASDPADEGQSATLTEGRYLYCLVDLTASETDRFSATGLNDTAVYILQRGSVGAVVHECETIYDSKDPEQVKHWVLTHQQVVDTAGEIFGTPLPMRFDTILEGDDATVKQWLHEYEDRINEELRRFAGTWEYRIHLFWDPSTFEQRVTEQNERLQELQRRQQRSGAGKRFLLEKQYENGLRELRNRRRTELTELLRETVRPVAEEVAEQNPHSAPPEASSSSERKQVTRLAVRAQEADESTLGAKLDEIVEREGIEIKFTGPWPPYTFAPDIE